ncbi:SGNH/GDSL hydrolase family protein [Modestobacter sp. I12A-02628]|uniref:SGNH/GDSL hydrolase family protein n=1 Tax=Goekera deserti TaxID=2497753 RepID=A0A7K3WD31_9ACTN|nr:GDSL-type esterase/lipase family protein [Goekera deserti]MPQ98274.1 SGNH/GDSL hydrolase family protein [Goekera deserti]NDI48100.1 SGNH/GDSL hydrolase family protein [Goekera deserti]NEL53849.1 SGNH/GDSL hydrolase family protein [Goekera deserti]
MPTHTTRARALVLVLTAVLAVLGLGVAPASARPADRTPPAGSTYLALGDSVPFGFRANNPGGYADAADFVGYPELVAQDLGLRLLNATCPGETTSSFIDVTAASNGCTNRNGVAGAYRDFAPLHVPYPLPESQLDYAVQTLRATPDVSLVTLQLGANNAFICQTSTPGRCTGADEQAALLGQVQGELDQILTALREQAHYTGRIVVVTYYALQYSGGQSLSTLVLDTAIAATAREHDATIANGYAAFLPRARQAGGSSVAAGLVLPGDVHPTADGQRLLADAVEHVLRRR